MSQTLDQRRARHAWELVQKAQGRASDDFRRQAKRMPAMILTSGLGPTLAYVKAKDTAPQLLSGLADWILDKKANPTSTKAMPAPDELVKEIMRRDSVFLRRSTSEALAYLQWITRFAESEGTDSP